MPTVRLSLLALGLLLAWHSNAGAQQVPDPDFEARVDRPAYGSDGPKVMIDEAHFNVHTSEGSYKAFADLASRDGYTVVANDRPFSADSLSGVSVLVIANARSAPIRSEKPAFREAEVDALSGWIQGLLGPVGRD